MVVAPGPGGLPGNFLFHRCMRRPCTRFLRKLFLQLLHERILLFNISNHWSFPDKEGEKFSMEIFHSFSTIFSQFFHTERSGVWKFWGNFVEIEWKIGMENFSPGVSGKRKLVIDLSISFNLWSITPTCLGGFQGGVFARSEAECGKTPPWWGFLRGEAP